MSDLQIQDYRDGWLRRSWNATIKVRRAAGSLGRPANPIPGQSAIRQDLPGKAGC